MSQNCFDLHTRLYPTSYKILTDKVQKHVWVHVVITYVRVPVHFLNLNLSIEREQVKIFKDYLKVHTYRWERESWRVWLCKI